MALNHHIHLLSFSSLYCLATSDLCIHKRPPITCHRNQWPTTISTCTESLFSLQTLESQAHDPCSFEKVCEFEQRSSVWIWAGVVENPNKLFTLIYIYLVSLCLEFWQVSFLLGMVKWYLFSRKRSFSEWKTEGQDVQKEGARSYVCKLEPEA